MTRLRIDLRLVFLVSVGFLQMVGDLTHCAALKAVGAATAASPAPKVFSSVNGLETFSSKFFLNWTDDTGQTHELALTPEIYARIAGPYNRRNVFGAALAYGPILEKNARTRNLVDSTIRYATCGDAPLVRELAGDPGAPTHDVRIRLVPRSGTQLGDAQFVVRADCR